MNATAPGGRGRWVSVFVLFLLASTAIFVVGAVVERNQGHQEPTSPSSEQGSGGSETGAHVEGSGEAAHTEATTPGAEQSGESGSNEKLFGVDPEGAPAVIVAVLVALLVAAAAWWRPVPLVLVIGFLFCLAAAGLDIREIVHQVDGDNTGVAVLAGLVTLLHLLAAVAAAAALTNVMGSARRRSRPNLSTS